MSLAELKRRLVPGTRATMVSHSWYPGGGGIVGMSREVVESNIVGVTFAEPSGQCSTLEFPRASELEMTENGFVVNGAGNLRI